MLHTGVPLVVLMAGVHFSTFFFVSFLFSLCVLLLMTVTNSKHMKKNLNVLKMLEDHGILVTGSTDLWDTVH